MSDAISGSRDAPILSSFYDTSKLTPDSSKPDNTDSETTLPDDNPASVKSSILKRMLESQSGCKFAQDSYARNGTTLVNGTGDIDGDGHLDEIQLQISEDEEGQVT